MTQQQRVYYLGMITTDAYGQAVGERTYAGAAARKMVLVARAMRKVGLRAIVVSLPFVGTSAKRPAFGPVIVCDGGVPIVFTPTLRSAIFRKLVGQFILAVFFMRHARRNDAVICYNHAIEYLLALLFLRLKGVRIIQDIEDAPSVEEVGLRGLLNRASFAFTSRISEPRKMVVADHVAKGIGLNDYITIRGVASEEIGVSPSLDLQKWDDLRMGGTLKLHFGGSLMTETGVDLFCEAVELLARCADRLTCRVSFKVTGVGDLDKIRDLQGRIGNDASVDVELQPELSKAEYLALIGGCHGSMSLKRPGSVMSNTTFPSKVIEITAAGLALVSTRLGDVAEIFGEDSAYFIDGYRPEDLVEILIGMVADPDRVERVAAAGRKLCNELFTSETVGEEMKRLL